MDKQFKVGDIVVWDETSPNYEYGEPYFGLGPFQIINLCTKEGHISIKKIPEANTGTYTGGEFTCGAKDIRPAVFLTAIHKALHEKI